MSDKLRWGIIGCGDVVERKSGPSIEATGRSRIMAVMRRDEARARSFAEAHRVPVWTNDARAVVTHPDVDIVYVATPPHVHEKYVQAAASAGKHVLVEKPMGLNATEAERMIAACDGAGVEFFVSYYRRFQPDVQEMRKIIEQGRIGEPVQAFIDLAKPVRGRDFGWRERPQIGGGGHFVDVGCHRLDVMVFLLGDVTDVKGVSTTFDKTCRVEQTVSVCVKFASGAQCVATGDYYSGRKADRLEIVGTAGALRMNSLDSYAFTLATDRGEEKFTFEKLPAPHFGLMRHIEDVLAGNAKNQCSGRDGLMTEIILDEAVRKQLRQG